ncbi:hypothetical protein WS70_24390 [Burkholderia mayonis]|uniref:Uncharacterized protein n=1 Tax=Burkholderia mayonis TaxID=1385591 RepID=A0A1B4FMK8_9BURK|nr:hypothetical protein WS70_24390 [Burkholderia mayonis]KVE40819.1 hypothetical protein WS70_16155 [Burkholderia mayonis]
MRAPRDMLDALTPLRAALAAVFVVADVRLEAGEEIAVAVTRTRLARCERCRRHEPTVDAHAGDDARCERCRHALSRRVLAN